MDCKDIKIRLFSNQPAVFLRKVIIIAGFKIHHNVYKENFNEIVCQAKTVGYIKVDKK